MTSEELTFFPLCTVAEMPNGARKVFTVGGRSVLLLRVAGQFHALRNKCAHLNFPLETGRQVGFSIFCRKHGAEFDIRTGKPLAGPAVKTLEVYATRVVGDMVEAAIPKPDPNAWPE